jgi:septal ring factor EnvC (AmiA/AmiB activator)
MQNAFSVFKNSSLITNMNVASPRTDNIHSATSTTPNSVTGAFVDLLITAGLVYFVYKYRKERNDIRKECDEVRKDRDEVRKERDEVRKDRDEVRKERDDLLKENNNLLYTCVDQRCVITELKCDNKIIQFQKN